MKGSSVSLMLWAVPSATRAFALIRCRQWPRASSASSSSIAAQAPAPPQRNARRRIDGSERSEQNVPLAAERKLDHAFSGDISVGDEAFVIRDAPVIDLNGVVRNRAPNFAV